MKIILLEKIEKLGKLGDIVTVKSGYARNFLLPFGKAIRANKDNMKKFESEKEERIKLNEELKSKAITLSKSLDNISITIIRAASEAGQLYGSVSTKDICNALEKENHKINKQQIILNNTIKTLGLYSIKVMLHPEVICIVEINVARSIDEAKTQKKIGKALIDEENKTDDSKSPQSIDEDNNEKKEIFDQKNNISDESKKNIDADGSKKKKTIDQEKNMSDERKKTINKNSTQSSDNQKKEN